LDRDRGSSPAQCLNEKAQIVSKFAPADQRIGVRMGAKVRDAVTDERIRVLLIGIQLGQQLLGARQLLRATTGRGESHLLIRQLLEGRDLKVRHDHYSFWSHGSEAWCATCCEAFIRGRTRGRR